MSMLSVFYQVGLRSVSSDTCDRELLIIFTPFYSRLDCGVERAVLCASSMHSEG